MVDYQPDSAQELLQRDDDAPRAVDVEVIAPMSVRRVPTRSGAAIGHVLQANVPSMVLPGDPTRSRARLSVYDDVHLAGDPNDFGTINHVQGTITGGPFLLAPPGSQLAHMEMFHRDPVWALYLAPNPAPGLGTQIQLITEHWAD